MSAVFIVTPAKAGAHLPDAALGDRERWVPAFAGMTVELLESIE